MRGGQRCNQEGPDWKMMRLTEFRQRAENLLTIIGSCALCSTFQTQQAMKHSEHGSYFPTTKLGFDILVTPATPLTLLVFGTQSSGEHLYHLWVEAVMGQLSNEGQSAGSCLLHEVLFHSLYGLKVVLQQPG